MRVFALLPAAGKSSRMGCSKLALPIGDRTVLERVLDTLRSAAIADIVVVLAPAAVALKAQAEQAGAVVLVLEEETPDMRATILRGLDWLESKNKPLDDDAFLLLPADHPTLVAHVIDALRQAAVRGTHASIWIPTWQGQRGHPALIAWKHVAGIRAMAAGQGLNVYLRQHADETVEVPVSCPDILWDLDTPQDYERIRNALEAS